MAGFEVITYGRFWVIAEENGGAVATFEVESRLHPEGDYYACLLPTALSA
jgi:hypothetical protein